MSDVLDEKVFKLIEGGQKIDLFKDDSKKTKIPKTIMDFIGQDSSVYTEDYWKKFKRGEGGLSKETIMNLVGKEPGKEININKSLNWEGDALDRWNNAIQNMPKENKEKLGISKMNPTQTFNYFSALMNFGLEKDMQGVSANQSFYKLLNEKEEAMFVAPSKWGGPSKKPLSPDSIIKAFNSLPTDDLKKFNESFNNVFGDEFLKTYKGR